MKVSQLSGAAQILLWVRASLDRLYKSGLIEGSFPAGISPKGDAIADQLLASDQVPDREDVKSAIRFLFRELDEGSVEGATQLMLMKAWREAE